MPYSTRVPLAHQIESLLACSPRPTTYPSVMSSLPTASAVPSPRRAPPGARPSTPRC
jgi:hypothetical protein